MPACAIAAIAFFAIVAIPSYVIAAIIHFAMGAIALLLRPSRFDNTLMNSLPSFRGFRAFHSDAFDRISRSKPLTSQPLRAPIRLSAATSFVALSADRFPSNRDPLCTPTFNLPPASCLLPTSNSHLQLPTSRL